MDRIIEKIGSQFEILNNYFDALFLGLFVIGLVIYNVWTIVSSVKSEFNKSVTLVEDRKKGLTAENRSQDNKTKQKDYNSVLLLSAVGRAMYLWLIFAALQAFIMGIFLWVPLLVPWISAELVRWLLLFIILSRVVYAGSKKHSGRRGLYSLCVIHHNIVEKLAL